MNREIKDVIKNLTALKYEEEWFEFKENWFNADGIGEYISSLSNAAAMKGREEGYLIWGIRNNTHEITGSSFNCHQEINGEPLSHYLARNITPDVNFECAAGTIPFHKLNLGSATQVATQVGTQVERQNPGSSNFDEIIRKILDFCAEPKSTKEISDHLGFKERKSTSRYLKPLIEQGRLAMMIPDKPNSSKQKYITIK